jgi:hypothetical protein
LAIAAEECNALRETNAAVSAHNALLQSQTRQVQQFNALCSRFLVLSHHTTSLMQSTNQRIPCYNSKKPFYILAVSIGKTLYWFFDCLFGSRHGRKLNDTNPGIGMRLAPRRRFLFIEGEFSCSHTKVHVKWFRRSRLSLHRRAVHKAHVIVDPHTGEVTGLRDLLILDCEIANFSKDNPDAFAQFVRNHSHMIAKFSFVFYLTRLDPREKAFPMVILSSVQGQTTNSTVSCLSIACQILVDEGIDLRGTAFDGDIKHLHYLDLFKTGIDDPQKINLRSPFSRIVPHEGPGIFEDKHYSLKTIWHCFVKDAQYFPLPFVVKPMINQNA